MEKECPRCKTTSYNNPSMKIMVNECGHKLIDICPTAKMQLCYLHGCPFDVAEFDCLWRICETCVNAVFSRPTAACPTCKLTLRKNNFREQQFEDSSVEKEVDIRKKLLKDYNRCEEDFVSLTEYNEYLEEFEDIVYNLTYGMEVEKTKQKVEQYRKENQDTILEARERKRRHEQAIVTELEEEQTSAEFRNKIAHEREEDHIRKKQKTTDSLISALMSSDHPASEVLARHIESNTEEKPSIPSYSIQKEHTTFELIPEKFGVMYQYQPQNFETHGPAVPQPEVYRQTDSTSTQFFAGQKAVEEAFSCLMLFSSDF